jgi:two-component system C4-dicarboxylate transport response regulator DctD
VAALARLGRYDWPGNVRELLNVSERRVIRHAGRLVDETQLDGILDDIRVAAPPSRDAAERCIGDAVATDDPVALIASELRATGGNVARAARRLGLPRSTLRHWIRRHDIR